MNPKTAAGRTRDWLYVTFLALHAVATIVIDIQPVVPATWIPKSFKRALQFYLNISHDPLMRGASSGASNYLWFRWFLAHEFLFFLPTYFLGIRGLIRRDPRVYPLLLAYGAAATTTTATCLIELCYGASSDNLTKQQMALLLSSYAPFFLAPLVILVDMYFRLVALLAAATIKSKIP